MSGIDSGRGATAPPDLDGTSDFVTMTIGGQLFGVPVLEVHDVLSPQRMTHVPLAPSDVAGVLNLRGRIVTAIDVRKRLGMPPLADDAQRMSVVVEYGAEPYSLLIDEVGEVLSLPAAAFERNPATLDPRWREISGGIYRLERGLMVVLDVEKLLDFSRSLAA